MDVKIAKASVTFESKTKDMNMMIVTKKNDEKQFDISAESFKKISATQLELSEKYENLKNTTKNYE